MAAVSNFIWVALLLACGFQTSDSQNVRQVVYPVTDRGISLINADASGTCTSNEALGLRREVSQLKVQLATCSSAASAITGSYRNQLRGKMTNLLNTFDSDPFLILKTIALNKEVNALQEKLKRAANSTSNVIDTTALQKELEKQYAELNRTMLQIEGTLPNPSLILQVISLQNQIWNLEQLKLQGRETTPQQDKAILALQEQLDQLLIQLRVKGEEDVSAAMLQLISVQTKIAMTQRLINIRIEESRANDAVYQRQWKTKADLLRKKILQLSRDEGNKALTKEILQLQMEVEHFRQLMSGAKSAIDSRLRALRTVLVEQKKLQQQLQEQLEEAEYAQAQLIMKAINIMKEMRELEVNEQDEVTSQATTLQAVIQAKEKEYAKAQAEIIELKKKLVLKFPTWSEVDKKLWPLKTKFEQELARLKRIGEPEVALVLTLIKVRDELETLQEQIAVTDDPKRLSELQRQLEEKQEELLSKTEDAKRTIPNYNIISNIIELQDEIWGLEKRVANETNVRQIEELQNRVNRLITRIGPDGNTKTVLKLLTLQSQINRLQRRLADIHMFEGSQVNELRNNLMFKRKELQTLVDDLKKKNETNTGMVLAITDLQNQLRNLEQERHDDYRTASFTTTELRKELKDKIMEHARDHAQITALQNLLQDKERELGTVLALSRDLQRKLRLKSAKCSDTEETSQREVKMSEVKGEFEKKIAELMQTGNSKAASGLEMLNLNDEVVYLMELISETEDPNRISELRAQIDEKQEELYSSLNMSDFLTSTLDMSDARELVIKIPVLQSQVEELQRQISAPSLQTRQKNKLINDLATKKRELQKSVDQLNQKSQTDVSTIVAVIDLYNQLRLLERERLNINPVSAVTTKLREQLKTKEVEQRKAQDQIKALQRQLNLTEERCSAFEEELKGLQTDLDDKMKELQSKSDTVTALALQVSTLTVQVEGLKRQAQGTVSEVKVKELEKIIATKNNELASKTEELKARSSQAEQLLKIITTQSEIERLADVAENEEDYANISALQDNLNRLISEIQDENNENTKLIFKILAHQDEIARLKKQQESETRAKLEKIKGLENELEDIRSEIKEKTLLLDSSDTRIANLSARVMELYEKIKPMEDEISSLKEANANSIAELQKKLEQSKSQLQGSKLQLEQEGRKSYNLIVEITDLRTKLKKAQEEGAVAEKQKISDLEQQIETQQRENRKLENTNEDLKQEMNELKTCCDAVNTQCDELEEQVQQCNKDADRLLQQLQEKDVRFNEQQDELEEKTREYDTLQQDYRRLQNDTEQLEEFVQELQSKLKAEDNAIRASKMVFDPDTANARLGLAARNTQVFIANEVQNVHDHPGRFNVFLAVLGKTGFSSGRHYWEASVAEKPCYHLGMASESARRRGQIRISPVTGFWTIIRNKQGQYQAMDRTRINIPMQTQPLTVGILLDYEKGQISFYDAGARVHMYSFTGQTFRNKIHPFINFCVDTVGNQIPIVLVTPGETGWINQG